MTEVGWQHAIKDRTYTFETSVSVHGTLIDIKHCMAYTDIFSKSLLRRKASWIGAINVLATATHMDLESQLIATLSAEFSMRITPQLITEDVCWAEPFYSLIVGSGVRTLIQTSRKNMVKISGAGACHKSQKLCYHIIIRHRSLYYNLLNKPSLT